MLPREFQQVEYLESSGAQRINTDIDVSDDNVIECTVYTYAVNTTFIFGSTYNGWATNILGWNSGSQTVSYYLSNKGFKFYETGLMKITASKDSFTVNGVSITPNTDTNSGGGKFCIFSCWQRVGEPGRRYGTFKLYSLKISNAGSSLGNYIPCYRKLDNKPGLYDIVTNTFFTNAGTGEFTVGPNV